MALLTSMYYFTVYLGLVLAVVVCWRLWVCGRAARPRLVIGCSWASSLVLALAGMRTALAADGMNRLLDVAMAAIGEAYLAEKERLILRQQEAIRELSTPVLQFREQMLILPVVANLGVYVFTRRRESLHANARQRRERKARSQARRRLKDART